MLGHDDLVCRDDVLAGLDRALDVRPHRLVAARDLHHDLDPGIVQDLVGVGGQQVRRDVDRTSFGDLADEDLLQAQLDAGPARELRTPREHPLGDLRADGAEADQADVERAGLRHLRPLFSLPWR